MTHEYVVLVGGRVVPAGDRPDVSAVAWAGDTILALGSDDEVRSISRGDSRFVSIAGATVIPINDPQHVTWPNDACLEVGGRADLAVLDVDPGAGGEGEARPRVLAVVVAGHVVKGELAGFGPAHREVPELPGGA